MLSNEPGGRAPFPRVVFDAALFRGLDARAEREIEAASVLRDLAPSAELYRGGDEGETFFIVASGKVAILAKRRGEDSESVIRVVGPGESFGEEAVAQARRRGAAIAEGGARLPPDGGADARSHRRHVRRRPRRGVVAHGRAR